MSTRAVVTCECACAEIAWLPGRKPRQPQEAPHSRAECGLLVCAGASTVVTYTATRLQIYGARDLLPVREERRKEAWRKA